MLEKEGSNIKDETKNSMGKLRAVDGLKNQYVLFDNGESYVNPGFDKQNLRREMGSFTYRYEPCNIGNIRKMVVIYPAVACYKFKNSERDNKNYEVYTFLDQRPRNNRETLMQ
jgi:hypothetical protein